MGRKPKVKGKVVKYIEEAGCIEKSSDIGKAIGENPRSVRSVIQAERLRDKYPSWNETKHTKKEASPKDMNELQAAITKAKRNLENGKLKDFNWRKIFENAQRTAEVESQMSNVKTDPVTVVVKPDKHGFGRLIFTGDWHIGNMGTDYEALAAMINYIKKLDIGIIGLADYIENFIRPIGGNWIPVLSQALPPKHQKAAYFSILQEISEQIKLLILEWHDDRERRTTGMDTMDFLKWNFPIRHNRSILKVKCGDAEYTGVVAHRLKGNSIYNEVHDNIRQLLFSSPSADFIVSAHSHVPADMSKPFQGRQVPLIKVGAFNSNAEYAVTSYGKSSFISCPILYFDSQKRVSTPIKFPGFFLDKIITPKIEDFR